MTEKEWQSCSDPGPMFGHLRDQASQRKLRLFCVALCRRIWGLMPDDQSRHAVLIAEQFADGLVDQEQLAAARAAISHAHLSHEPQHRAANAAFVAVEDRLSAYGTSAYSAREAVRYQAFTRAMVQGARRVAPGVAKEEHAAQVRLLRDIFGNPFRPLVCHPTWLTSPVKAITEAIYGDRRFEDLPILADTLEDAGCDNAAILNHCRQPGEHVRGCWVVDLLTGRS